MAKVKTAVSIDRRLFEELEDFAREKHVARSRLFEHAVKEFLEQRKSRLMLKELNAVYGTPDAGEKAWLDGVKRKHKKTLEEPW